jgi:hypothetical protein
MTNYAVTQGITQALQYELSLDGNVYISTVYWNIFGQRLYINISDQYGNSILNLPMIGSPPDTTAVNMLAGYFTTSTLYYYPANQLMVVDP